AVQRPLVLADVPVPGVVVGAGDGRAELLPGPVHQLVDQHGHENGLARFLGPDRDDHASADLAEVNREPAVTHRADPDRGLGVAGGAHGRPAARVGGKRRRQRAAEARALEQHGIGLRRAALAGGPEPAAAPEPRRPAGDLLVAVRAVDGHAAGQPHRSLISWAGGGKSSTRRVLAAGAAGSIKQASQAGPQATSTGTVTACPGSSGCGSTRATTSPSAGSSGAYGPVLRTTTRA